MADKSLFIDIPWTSQPQGAVEIDWQPGDVRLAYNWCVGQSNLVSNAAVATLRDTASIVKHLSVSGVQCGVPTSPLQQQDIIINAYGTARCSIQSGVLQWVQQTATQTSLYESNHWDVGGFELSANANGSISVDKQNTAVLFTTAAGLVKIGDINTVAWSYNNITGRLRIAVNGKVSGTTATSTLSHNETLLGRWIQWAGTIASNPNIQVLFLLSGKECFSDAYLASVSQNPWQIFKPRRVYLSFAPRQPWSMRESRMRGITDLVTTTVKEDAFTRHKPLVNTRQPQGAGDIDWSNPICSSIQSIVVPFGIKLIDITNNKILNNDPTAELSLTKYLGVTGIGRRTNSSDLNNTTNLPIKKERVSSYTVMWHGELINTSGRSILFRNIATTLGSTGVFFFIRPGDTTDRITNVASSPGRTTIALSQNGPMYALSLNGNLILKGVNGGSIAFSSWTIDGNTGFNESFDASTNLFLVFDKGLDDCALNSLTTNPWQIFKANKTPLFYNRTLYKDVPRYTPPSIESETAEASRIITVPSYVRTTQPQGACEIDWANPICKDLVVVHNTGNMYSITPNGTMRRLYVPLGGARAVLTVAGKGLLDSGWRTYVTSAPLEKTITNPSELTTLALSTPDASTGISGIYGIGNGNAYAISSNNNIGELRKPIGTMYISGIGNIYCGGTLSIPAETPFVGVLRFIRNTELAIFINGIKDSNTVVPGSFYAPFSDFGGADGPRATVILGYLWARALSDQEIASISENPWQIFKSTNTPIFGGGAQ